MKRQENRQAKLRLRLWVVAEKEEARGGGDVMCNNIHALSKFLRAPLVCMCVHALVLRASLLALINNSQVLLVPLPSSLHSLPQLPLLSSLFSPNLISPLPITHTPPKNIHTCMHAHTLKPFITHHTIVAPFSTPVLRSPQPAQASVCLTPSTY